MTLYSLILITVGIWVGAKWSPGITKTFADTKVGKKIRLKKTEYIPEDPDSDQHTNKII